MCPASYRSAFFYTQVELIIPDTTYTLKMERLSTILDFQLNIHRDVSVWQCSLQDMLSQILLHILFVI